MSGRYKNNFIHCRNQLDVIAKTATKPKDVGVLYCILNDEIFVFQSFKVIPISLEQFAEGLNIDLNVAQVIIHHQTQTIQEAHDIIAKNEREYEEQLKREAETKAAEEKAAAEKVEPEYIEPEVTEAAEAEKISIEEAKTKITEKIEEAKETLEDTKETLGEKVLDAAKDLAKETIEIARLIKEVKDLKNELMKYKELYGELPVVKSEE